MLTNRRHINNNITESKMDATIHILAYIEPIVEYDCRDYAPPPDRLVQFNLAFHNLNQGWEMHNVQLHAVSLQIERFGKATTWG